MTVITYRKTLLPTSDPGDREIFEDRPTSVVWALGRLARNGRWNEPSFHHTYPKNHVTVDFGRKEAKNNCFPFTKAIDKHVKKKKKTNWGPFR